jgi:hypothetical protein
VYITGGRMKKENKLTMFIGKVASSYKLKDISLVHEVIIMRIIAD